MKAAPWWSIVRFRALVTDGVMFAAACVVSLGIGYGFDRWWREQPLGWVYYSPAERLLQAQARAGGSPDAEAALRIVSIAEVEAALNDPSVLLLDAQPHVFYEMEHLPGARSLSREQFADDFVKIEPLLREPGRTLLIYCSDAECADSSVVASNLLARGFSRVWLFKGGLAEWQGAGLPTESAL